ncbi:MAG: glycosyltransferase family 2 protein [Bdellovibrionales bacterium]
MPAEISDLNDYKLSIVVPVFNEAEHLTENLDTLLGEVEQYFKNFEIIVVSDGSTDETNLHLVRFRHPNVRPLFSLKNTGKGAAVRKGFEMATGKYILFIDGGLEIHPKEIRIFMGLMALYQVDIVIGSKRHPQSRVEYPWYRQLLSWMFQKMIRFLFDIDVTDTQVGIKLFRREVIDAILPHLQIDRYGFDLELLSLAKMCGYGQTLEAPIRMDYFLKNKRPAPLDLLHVIKVGFSLMTDTIRLYRRLESIRPIIDQARPDSGQKRVS